MLDHYSFANLSYKIMKIRKLKELQFVKSAGFLKERPTACHCAKVLM